MTDVRTDLTINLNWTTYQLDRATLAPDESARITNLTVHTTTLTTRQGNVFTHEIREMDGRWWITQCQEFPDDGTGFALVAVAKEKVRQFYQAEVYELLWKISMRNNPPVPAEWIEYMRNNPPPIV